MYVYTCLPPAVVQLQWLATFGDRRCLGFIGFGYDLRLGYFVF